MSFLLWMRGNQQKNSVGKAVGPEKSCTLQHMEASSVESFSSFMLPMTTITVSNKCDTWGGAPRNEWWKRVSKTTGVMIGIAAPGWTYCGWLFVRSDGLVWQYISGDVKNPHGNGYGLMVMVAGVFVILFLTMAADLADLLSIDAVLPPKSNSLSQVFPNLSKEGFLLKVGWPSPIQGV